MEKGILLAKDTDADGKIDDIKSFGNYIGTGLLLRMVFCMHLQMMKFFAMLWMKMKK
jgi:hypothetical protein